MVEVLLLHGIEGLPNPHSVYRTDNAIHGVALSLVDVETQEEVETDATDTNGNATFIGLSAGQYDVTGIKRSHADKTIRVSLGAGEDENRELELVPFWGRQRSGYA